MPAPQAREPSDRDLVERFLSVGSEAAFRELYRRHAPRLYAFVGRWLGGADQEEAEEVLQAVWLRAAEGLAGFGWRSSLPTWLTGIAVNVCRDARRRRAASPVALSLEAAQPPIVSGAPQALTAIDLERAITALPEGYREVLLLHDVEGCTHREIAALLGVEEGTSKSQLSRARRAVRARLATAAGA